MRIIEFRWDLFECDVYVLLLCMIYYVLLIKGRCHGLSEYTIVFIWGIMFWCTKVVKAFA